MKTLTAALDGVVTLLLHQGENNLNREAALSVADPKALAMFWELEWHFLVPVLTPSSQLWPLPSPLH